MKHSIYPFSVLLIFLFVFTTCTNKDDFPLLKGPYLVQKPPGMTPKIFAPEIISTGYRGLHKSFSEMPLTYEDKIRILNSPGNGVGDIYWVDAKIIEQFKPDDLK